MRVLIAVTTLLIFIGISGCYSQQKQAAPLFGSLVPLNLDFQDELKYLDTTHRLDPRDRKLIELEGKKVQETLGVPYSILWCLLFQESRFDTFKNAQSSMPAKGLGQFTQAALNEVNQDRDHFDSRTSGIFSAYLDLGSLPLSFKLKDRPLTRKPGSVRKSFPEQPLESYFRSSTAVFASASFLNNRYRQIRSALDSQKLSYDPEVLWFFAVAAYNKGARAVFLLLNHELLSRGETALSFLLSNPRAARSYLSRKENLDYPLRYLWSPSVRARYLTELQRTMEIISSCTLPSEGTT